MFEDLSEHIASTKREALFYKCPVGGYVSLRPGACPKCREPLEAHIEADDRRHPALRDRRNLTAGAEQLSVSKQLIV